MGALTGFPAKHYVLYAMLFFIVLNGAVSNLILNRTV